MSRWARRQEWLADRFTDWLTSPAALIHGTLLAVLPWLPVLFGVRILVVAAVVMDVLTVGSWITQFPLAYSSRRGEQHMLKMMRLLVASAEQIDTVVDQVFVATQTLLRLSEEVRGDQAEILDELGHFAAGEVLPVVDPQLDMEETG